VRATLRARPALVVVDAQEGFDDPSWGPTNNPACDDNIARLVTAWSEHGLPLVYVRHDSAMPGSPLHPSRPGNRLRPHLRATPDLLVSKQVNSSFHGTRPPRLSATNLHGEFAEVVTTDALLEALAGTSSGTGGASAGQE
jgi:nicotinamidase-related amidase